jgi:hypothetical protein
MADHQAILEMALDMMIRKAAATIPDLKPGPQLEETTAEIKTTVLAIAAKRIGLPPPRLTPIRKD